MKEQGILFKAEMVRAILDGHKTLTSRLITPDYFGCFTGDCPHEKQVECDAAIAALPCRYGPAGRRLWVRETWLSRGNGKATLYRADYDPVEAAGIAGMYGGWKPSIHMHQWRARITLETVRVWPSRLQDMTEEQAIQEGIERVGNGTFDGGGPAMGPTAIMAFMRLWDSINAKTHPWASNPWVWRIQFRRIT